MGPAMAFNEGNCLWVRGIPIDCQKEDLLKIFRSQWSLSKIEIIWQLSCRVPRLKTYIMFLCFIKCRRLVQTRVRAPSRILSLHLWQFSAARLCFQALQTWFKHETFLLNLTKRFGCTWLTDYWQNPWWVAGFHQELWTRSQRSYSERAIDKMPQRLCFRSNLSPAAEAAISSHFSTMSWDDVGGLHAVMWNLRRDVSQVEPYRVIQDLTSVSGVIQHGFLCIAWGQHVQSGSARKGHACPFSWTWTLRIHLAQTTGFEQCHLRKPRNQRFELLNDSLTQWNAAALVCRDFTSKFACRKSQVTMTTSSEAQERLIGWKHMKTLLLLKGRPAVICRVTILFQSLAHAAEPFASWILICTTDRTSIEVAICKDCIRALHCAELGGVGQLRRVFSM